MPDDPIKRRAYVAVRLAVAAGALPRPDTLPCADCDRPAVEYDHHNGYDLAHCLDVLALCRRCHMKRGVSRGERKPPPKRTHLVSMCVVCEAAPPHAKGRCNACYQYWRTNHVERPTRLWTTARR